MQVYCNDLYDLNTENTKLYNEHEKWYNEFKAMSIGDLIDKQQDMIDSYRKAVDTSTQEISDLKFELNLVRNTEETFVAKITDLKATIELLTLKIKEAKVDKSENMIGQL